MCATSWCGLDLTFDLALVTLTYKIRKLLLGQDIGGALYVYNGLTLI